MGFTHEVTRGDAARIVRSAYDVVIKSMRLGLDADYLIMAPDNVLGVKRMAALRFAQLVTKHLNNNRPIPIINHTLPRPQYISWLTMRPFGIVYDRTKMLKGPLIGKGSYPSANMQIARAIIHELGHIFATPNLFSTKRSRPRSSDGTIFSPLCSPEEEGEAWLWAGCVWATQLAFHAWNQRKKGSFDNAMGATI
jgi:hypothetical protein